ncbi:MAG TPA: ATP-binding cassette domain-containing protein, partial [Rhodopila sp.]
MPHLTQAELAHGPGAAPGALAAAVPLLELSGIGKSFGAVRALDGMDLAIGHAEVVGLMGDNGAGKSTLTKIIAGNFPPSQGQIRLEGAPVTFDRPADARNAGIEVMYQDLAIAENLTAAANVFLGRELHRRIGPLRVLDHRAMNRRAAELFRELKSETRAEDTVREMSGGQRQAVAIARTRLAKSKLVLMDEPTAAISVRQVA